MQPAVSDIAGMFNRACQKLLDNSFAEAEALFDRLITCGDHPAVMHNRALAVELQGRFEEACKLYQQVIGLFPTFVHSYIGLSNCKRYLGDYIQAERSLLQAIGVDPADCRPHILLSEIWFYQGPHDYNLKAIDAHLFAMRLANQHGSTHTQHYAQAYYSNGDQPTRYHMFAEGSLLALGLPTMQDRLREALNAQQDKLAGELVVAMLCNAGYVDLTQNSLLSKRKAEVGETTVVLCLDSVAMSLQQEFPEVVFILLEGLVPVKCTAAIYNSHAFNRIVAIKVLFVSELLRCNKAVVFCDGDIVWLKSTLPDLLSEMKANKQELLMQLETIKPLVYCSGFFIASPSPDVVELFDPCHQPPMCGGEQPVLNHIISLLQVRVGALDVSEYPNGLSWHVRKNVKRDSAAIVHYNYCLATEKPTLMQEYGHWFVPTSHDYQAQVIRETASFRPEAHVNRGHGGRWIEQAFFDHWMTTCNAKSQTNLIYLPVFWTDVYVHNQGREKLEAYIDSLEKKHRYFTVLQNANGFTVHIPSDLRIVAFSAGTDKLPANIHVVPIPLLKEVLPLCTQEPAVQVCFVGSLSGASDKDGIRTEMHTSLSKHSWYHFYQGAEWRRHMSLGCFNLCPSGFGPTSFRLYETLQLGRIPIYIHADPQPLLPYKEFVPWHRICCFVPRQCMSEIPKLLKTVDVAQMMKEIKNCRRYFTYEYVVRFISSTVHHMTTD